MAFTSTRAADNIAHATIAADKVWKRYVVANLSTLAHYDTLATAGGTYDAPTATARTVTAANSSNIATARTLARDIHAIYVLHIASADSHTTADSTNTIAFGLPALAESLANLITWANQCKAAYNAHRTQASKHPTNDGTNIVTAANATIQADLDTLLNDIKTQLIAHLASSPGSVMVVAV